MSRELKIGQRSSEIDLFILLKTQREKEEILCRRPFCLSESKIADFDRTLGEFLVEIFGIRQGDE